MPALSAVVITFNNEQTIADTLGALTWCDEIVVVDSGSTDRTVEICRERGCRVMHRVFDGFGRQKNFAVSAATNDWVLVVDSDEVVTAELRQEIRQGLEHDTDRWVGFEIPTTLVFMGHVMRFGGEFKKLHLRLFDRRAGNYNFSEIHERVHLDGPVGVLTGQILHASYLDVEHYFEKFNRYTSIAARQLDWQGKSMSRCYLALRFPGAFLYRYLVKGLILDGYPGFVWALFSTFHTTVKYIKLDELRAARRTDRS